MSKGIITVLLFQLVFFANAQYQTSGNNKGTGYYANPIFAGDYPDPNTTTNTTSISRPTIQTM